jgi:hypothetical protein
VSFERLPYAMDEMEERNTVGRIVVQIGPSPSCGSQPSS